MALCPGLPGWASTKKEKPIWILLKQETASGSGISWAICKSAPCSRQIPHQLLTAQFFTGRIPFLPPNQQRQSTEGTQGFTSHSTQKISHGKTSLDLNAARNDGVLGWQWHQLDHMQTICTSLQTDNHTNTLSLNFCRPGARFSKLLKILLSSS